METLILKSDSKTLNLTTVKSIDLTSKRKGLTKTENTFDLMKKLLS